MIKRVITKESLKKLVAEMDKRGVESAPVACKFQRDGKLVMEVSENDTISIAVKQKQDEVLSVTASGSGTFTCKKFFHLFEFRWNPESKSWRRGEKWKLSSLQDWQELLQKFCHKNCIDLTFCG